MISVPMVAPPCMIANFIWKSDNRYGNKILVTDELPDGQMVDQWEPVSSDSVKTPLEVRGIRLEKRK